MLTIRLAPRRTTVRSFGSLARGVTVTLAAAALASEVAIAGALGPGDAQLASGEYYDRVTFHGNSGERVLIEVTSTAFAPYLIDLSAPDKAASGGFGKTVPGAPCSPAS